MQRDFQPSRQQSDLADVIELLLEKGVVINADIVVSIGDTQLLGVQVRAAIASFETAAKYGLEFPEGTDMRRVAEAVGDPELAEEPRPRPPIDPTRGVNVTSAEEASEADEEPADGSESTASAAPESDGGADAPERITDRLGVRPEPDDPTADGEDASDDGDRDESTEGDE
ncbi:gas vesicle protein GvpJ [Natronobiforma cellulositropha]|uniref:gas vesicle protein GvpJ n=1 Tax=Natronobiforma cellulositropha TaxID=1679076 RepID=UPI0021D5D846|nr:gas vesicle protein [Natronobiforma cellulositropha]